MKKILFAAFALTALFTFQPAHAEDVIRIEFGSSYDRYTNDELRRRVWQLERAVAQLQSRVFQLEVQGPKVEMKTWTCILQSFGVTHTASASTRTAALAMVLKKCSDATNAIHCRESEAKCSND